MNLKIPSREGISKLWKGWEKRQLALFIIVSASALITALSDTALHWWISGDEGVPRHVSELATARCRQLRLRPEDHLHSRGVRTQSDRYVPGTQPVLLRRAKIWTGDANGTDLVHGDILMDKGLIKSVGHLSLQELDSLQDNLVTVDLDGKWVTPGLIDMHSHIGVSPAPQLSGSEDYNSEVGNIQPFLRAIDGLHAHDVSYQLSISGGVTTALVLPGSGNAIGGQGVTMKLRQTAERSPSSMLLEPPVQINGSSADSSTAPKWRHLKHALGENPGTSYSGTRMDNIWALRKAYNQALVTMQAQDAYCEKAIGGDVNEQLLEDFPEDLQWEALVDVLRGKVKVHAHCYEETDLSDLVALSNEFKFPIAAIHHASEAYLVPEILNRTYGGPPGLALFATNARSKRESYRSSEFASRILVDQGLKVAFKSDHWVLDERRLLYEAQQAYFYGLPAPAAIAAVTSTPAELLGLDHRVGFIRSGWDADIVIWDSHPLALGATPEQVWIDGIPQINPSFSSKKPASYQKLPQVPDFSAEASEALEYEGLPPLQPKKHNSPLVLFVNVKNVFSIAKDAVHSLFTATGDELGVVLVTNGSIYCMGLQVSCMTSDAMSDVRIVDLKGEDSSSGYERVDADVISAIAGGSISPGLVAFGSPLGLEHIASERSTNDGPVHDPLTKTPPKVLGPGTIVHALHGLSFASRDALLAYRAGVTTGVTAPAHNTFYSGLSVAFSLDAIHKLEDGAIVQNVAGLHIQIGHFGKRPSVSTQMNTLRRLLLEPDMAGISGKWFKKVVEGKIPLVVEAHSVDIIASLIKVKKEVESQTGFDMKLTITGASEAHLLATEIAEAGVGLILDPRPFPAQWEGRNILPGPPVTELSAVTDLLRHNVTVGIRNQGIWSARNLRFDVAWIAIEAAGSISKEQALALGSANLAKLLGVVNDIPDMVATEGGDLLQSNSKVVAVLTPRRNRVHFV